MFAQLIELFSPQAMEEEAPETLDAERLHIATCVLLLEIARADDEFSSEERDHIIETLRDRFSLSKHDAGELIQASRDKRRQSSDLWRFTSQVNESCTRKEKEQILEEIWRVVYADSNLNAHEDYLMHKLAKLLNLNHSQLIDAKMVVLREIRGSA